MKKLFTNDTFFLLVVLFAGIGGAFCGLVNQSLFPERQALNYILLLRAGCVFGLFISYRRHTKNVMKAVMGALLMAEITSAVCSLDWISNEIQKLCVPLSLIFSLLLFVNHLVINQEHHADRMGIRLNQLLVVLLAADLVVLQADTLASLSGFAKVSGIVSLFCLPCIMASIVCVESRLDSYRQNREQAGWTEETGYPEGYIHEYQKSKK